MKILITAGPTIEPLDPVRFISNHSTGAIGYKIAQEALKQGFEVCLISGPVHLVPGAGIEIVKVMTARQMKDEVIKRINKYDCLVMAAAVCDFRPRKKSNQKIKKKNALTVQFVKNPDILSEIGQKKGLIKIGFALETENQIKNGKNKLKEKKLDMIVVNTVGKKSNPFGLDAIARYTVIDKYNKVKNYNQITKKKLANIIVNELGKLLK